MATCCARRWCQVSGTLSVLAAPEDLSQALEVKAAHVEAIIKQARQMFDFVVLDVGRIDRRGEPAGARHGDTHLPGRCS